MEEKPFFFEKRKKRRHKTSQVHVFSNPLFDCDSFFFFWQIEFSYHERMDKSCFWLMKWIFFFVVVSESWFRSKRMTLILHGERQVRDKNSNVTREKNGSTSGNWPLLIYLKWMNLLCVFFFRLFEFHHCFPATDSSRHNFLYVLVFDRSISPL